MGMGDQECSKCGWETYGFKCVVCENQTLKAQLAMASEALDHYTKHPVYWETDCNGDPIPEGPSKVAIKALTQLDIKPYAVVDVDVCRYEPPGLDPHYIATQNREVAPDFKGTLIVWDQEES